jgi:hypothetical protein
VRIRPSQAEGEGGFSIACSTVSGAGPWVGKIQVAHRLWKAGGGVGQV